MACVRSSRIAHTDIGKRAPSDYRGRSLLDKFEDTDTSCYTTSMCKDISHGGKRCPSSQSVKNGGVRLPEDRVTRKLLSYAPNIASEFHEKWRQEYRKANGDTPRIKTTKDADWISEHGTDQVDIAATSYADLPADWRKENRDAATAVTHIVARRAAQGLKLDGKRGLDAMAAEVHSAWLSRPNNAYARTTDLGVPFAKLSEVEKDKDRDQVLAAVRAHTFAKRVDDALTGASGASNPLRHANSSVEGMSAAERASLIASVDEDIESAIRRRQRSWDSVVSEVSKKFPDLEPGTEEFDNKLGAIVLGDEKVSGVLKSKVERFRSNSNRINNLQVLRLAAEIPSEEEQIAAKENAPVKKRTPGKRIAALESLNKERSDKWDVETSSLGISDVNRAVYVAYGDRAESDRLLNGKASFSEIADEYARLSTVPVSLKYGKGRFAHTSRTDDAEYALSVAAASSILTEAGTTVSNKVARTLSGDTNDGYLSLSTESEDAFRERVIASGVLDSDEWDVPPYGTDDDRADYFIDLFRGKNNQGYEQHKDAVAAQELTAVIVDHHGRRRDGAEYNPADHMNPLF